VLGYFVVPAEIDGAAVSLLLDTGADTGLVTPELAAALRLPLDPGRRTLMQGTGGTGAFSPNVILPHLRLGGLELRGLSVPVGRLPSLPNLTPRVGGLLGAELMARFDLDIDVPRGRLALQEAACARTDWTGAVPLGRDGARLTAEAVLDGTKLTALIDTGARSILLSTRAARGLGVPQAQLDADPGGITSGVDLRETMFHWHRFASLRIGPVMLDRPVLTVAPLDEQAELLLGAPFFQARRVLLSAAAARMRLGSR
jgi:predicted aspartyl protease